jgi:hypothetical protein
VRKVSVVLIAGAAGCETAVPAGTVTSGCVTIDCACADVAAHSAKPKAA